MEYIRFIIVLFDKKNKKAFFDIQPSISHPKVQYLIRNFNSPDNFITRAKFEIPPLY